MDLGIAGKIAIITAASGGLGSAVARGLAAEGVHVALFSRSETPLQALARDIETEYGVRALAVAGDMRSSANVKAFVERVRVELGPPDILVLNTGRPPLPSRDALDENDDERWEDAYRTQLWGAVLLVRAVMPLLIERGWGRVISIGSASVQRPMPRHLLSTVFRAGVGGMMRHLANEVGRYGITVNTVCPASIQTDSLSRSYDLSERLKSIPMNRLGRPDELASVIAFLASDRAGFITGTSLHVDGGMVNAFS